MLSIASKGSLYVSHKCFLRHSDLDGWNCRSRKMLGPTVRPCARRSNRNRCHYRDLQDQNSWSRIVQEHSNGTLIGAKPSTNPHKAPASIWRVPGAAATAPSRACEVEPSASGFSLVKLRRRHYDIAGRSRTRPWCASMWGREVGSSDRHTARRRGSPGSVNGFRQTTG